MYDQIREIIFVLIFPTFVTNIIIASEKDSNADHDDEDGALEQPR